MGFVLSAAWALALSGGVAAQSATVPLELKQQAARTNAFAAEEMLLAVAAAGKRLVAVGDHGVVLLSDDDGKSFRQAKAVPTRVTLNAVSCADEKNGWACGHWGSIIRTQDGGETWTLQRTDSQTDRPLFAIHASDARHAVAVGLWSLLLTTDDGGQNWRDVKLQTPPDGGKADRNLLGLFASGKRLYATAEKGLVLRSDDLGNSWTYLNTGYKGSFWSGVALKDGTLLVAGLRGTIYRSADEGKTWQAVPSGTQSSITALAEVGDGVVAVALDGIVLHSNDQGLSFKASQREDRTSLTAVIANGAAKPIAFSKRGVVAELLPVSANK